MIKSEKGNVTISGIGADIISDFCCITAKVIDSMVENGLDVEFAEFIIDETVATAKKNKKNNSSRCSGKYDREIEVLLKKILGMEV